MEDDRLLFPYYFPMSCGLVAACKLPKTCNFQEYVSRLQARGHMFCETPSIAVVTGIVKEKEGKIYANSDFRKGEESSPAGY